MGRRVVIFKGFLPLLAAHLSFKKIFGVINVDEQAFNPKSWNDG